MIIRATGWLVFALTALSLRAENAPSFPLPAPVGEIVRSAETFARFVTPIKSELPSATGSVDRKMLLGLRVHLALGARDGAAALAAAKELRTLQTDATEQAFTGLITEAQVAAWQPGKKFERELGERLKALPHTPPMVALLRRQRDKIAATTREALLAEAAELDRRLGTNRNSTWPEADQIVRLHHRLNNILPLQPVLLAGLDKAIEEREHVISP